MQPGAEPAVSNPKAMNRYRRQSRAQWLPVLVPVLLAGACTPVPPAAAPTQEPVGQEAAATREPASSQVEPAVSHTPEPAERADDTVLPSSPVPEPSSVDSATVDFATDVQPILEVGCRPCHFEGGKMYAKLPFDRPETIRSLGEKRLFTRIKDEEERGVIRAFLEQGVESAAAEGGAEGPW